ncbi:MAG: outer membrane beta-barrel protein [Alphaproteobacteria bacterium]|nr:outer membrane beta-barrel protein [Alphaproteobacteria bacterium]
MKKLSRFMLLTGVAATVFTLPALARDLGESVWSKERFQLRVRGIGVLPDSGGRTSIGGSPDADNAIVPEFDISYFFTNHIAAELILATSPHDLTLKDRPGGAADLDLGDTMILPPTLTLQYHFTPDNKFSPYLGAGINYTLPYAENDGRDTTSLQADGSVGWALQGGADYWLDEHWGVNLDVKKVWVDVDASINNGAITGEVELDPWIVGAGVSYRF